MTAAGRIELKINIRERYLDVVSDRWPVAVPPLFDELLSSWLHRLAYANGVSPKRFARVLGLGSGMWSAALDLRLPTDVANLLGANTGVSPHQLSAMMLSHGLLVPVLLPLRSNGRRDGSTWLQFCSKCLADDAHPYFRRRWRLATLVSCTRHGCRLRDRCPSCRSRIAAFDQSELVPQHYCARCGYDLRRSSAIGISTASRRLDRCIDDITRLPAVTGSPSSKVLTRRLLSIPDLTGIYPTKLLTSLSTAIRTRCVERLADHTSDWLIVDDDFAVVEWQRLILLAGGHGRLIECLATGLDKRKQLHVRRHRRKPVADLAAFLQAYLRITQVPVGARSNSPPRRQDPDVS